MNVEDVFEIAKERNALAEHEVKSLLRDYGIPVPNFMVVNSPEDVESITLKFPVVVKASSPNILHKTDVGAVRLNVKDIEELKTVVKEFKEKFKDAKILIEEMEDKNLEVIVGVINDATFGPFRGIKVDREALVKILLRVSDLAQELEPVIDQLDLNPIFLKESGAVVVDAKMLLRRPK